VDVGPFVVADAEASELIEPGNVRSTTQRHRPRPLPCVVRRFRQAGESHGLAIRGGSPPCRSRDHRARRLDDGAVGPRSPCSGGIASTRARASCESFRLAPVRRTASGTPLSITDQMPFASTLGAVGRIGTVCVPPCIARTEQLRPPPSTNRSDLARQPIEQRKVDQIPNTGLLPIAQASPTGHSRAAAQFLRQHLPRNPASQHEKDTVRHTRSETRGLPPLVEAVEPARKVGLDPQRVGGYALRRNFSIQSTSAWPGRSVRKWIRRAAETRWRSRGRRKNGKAIEAHAEQQ